MRRHEGEAAAQRHLQQRESGHYRARFAQIETVSSLQACNHGSHHFAVAPQCRLAGYIGRGRRIGFRGGEAPFHRGFNQGNEPPGQKAKVVRSGMQPALATRLRNGTVQMRQVNFIEHAQMGQALRDRPFLRFRAPIECRIAQPPGNGFSPRHILLHFFDEWFDGGVHAVPVSCSVGSPARDHAS